MLTKEMIDEIQIDGFTVFNFREKRITFIHDETNRKYEVLMYLSEDSDKIVIYLADSMIYYSELPVKINAFKILEYLEKKLPVLLQKNDDLRLPLLLGNLTVIIGGSDYEEKRPEVKKLTYRQVVKACKFVFANMINEFYIGIIIFSAINLMNSILRFTSATSDFVNNVIVLSNVGLFVSCIVARYIWLKRLQYKTAKNAFAEIKKLS
jgi:hypothetical protein